MTIDWEKGRRQGASGAVLESTMSLVGKLEDLSLGEILQIVSLSKRSGLLWLESPQDRANIYIRSGKVIYAARSDETEGVISLLVHHGLVKLDQVDGIREELESSKSAGQFRGILYQRLGVTSSAFQQALKKRVQELVYSLFHWEEGTFSFQLIENEGADPLFARMSPLFLDEGINAQFLVMEGARRKDELGREPSAKRAAGAVTPGEESAQTQDEGGREFAQQITGKHVGTEVADRLIRELDEFEIPQDLPPVTGSVAKTGVLIGLNQALAAKIVDGARSMGITLLIQENGADGLTRIRELRQDRVNPFLILDIEAAGITDGLKAGGLEILSTLWDLGFGLHVGLVYRSALPDGILEKLGSVPGIRLFAAPDVSSEEETAEGILNVFERILSESAETQQDDQQNYYDIQQELSGDLEGIDLPFEDLGSDESPGEKSLDPHMNQLSSYVSELNRGDVSGEITLLALRFASFFVARAVLFLVKKDGLRGLGQFGVDLGEGKDADSAVQSLTLPLGAKGPLGTVTDSQRSYKGPPTGSETEKALFEALGGGIPGEIYVGPVISMGKVAVLLYGDDHPAKTGIEPTQTLDIFLSHVGLALDRAFLEMKLKTQPQ